MKQKSRNKLQMILSIVLVFILAFAFCACDVNLDDIPNLDTDDNAAQDDEQDGVTLDKLSSSFYYDDADGVRYSLSFSSDLVVEYALGETISKGTYVYSDNVLTVTLNDEEIVVNMNDGSIVLTIDEVEYKMIEMVNYTVTFYEQNGTAPSEVEVLNGKTVSEPETTPTYDGYTFSGWVDAANSATAFDFSSNITGNVNVYASWKEIPVYNAVSLSDYVSSTHESASLLVGDSFSLSVPDYDSIICTTVSDEVEVSVDLGVVNKFVGWYAEDGTKLTDASGVSLTSWTNRGDTSVYPMWTISEDYYTSGLTYNLINNGTEYEVYGNLDTQGIEYLVIPAYYNDLPVTKVNQFADHENLEYVYIPSTVTEIIDNPFTTSHHLKSYFTYVVDGVENTVYNYLDGIVYSNSNRTLEMFPSMYVDTLGEYVTEYTVDENVTEIGAYAFFIGIEDITSDYWWNAKTLYNDQLVTINLPDNLMTIGEGAFMNRQQSLSFVNFGTATDESIKLTIGDYAFYQCRFLFTYAFTNSTTEITYFYVNSEIEIDEDGEEVRVKKGDILTLPSNLVSIGDYAFYRGTYSSFGSTIKQDVLVIPEGVTSIGEYAFHGVNGFSELQIASTVSEIGEYAFAWSANNSSLMNYDEIETGFTKIVFAENSQLKVINESTFGYSRGLTDVILPQSLEEISNFAFINCYYLTNIELPSTLKTIGQLAFGNCINLDVDVSNVTTVDEDAFGIITTSISSRTSSSTYNYFFYYLDDLYNAGKVSENIKTIYIGTYEGFMSAKALRDNAFFRECFLYTDETEYSIEEYSTAYTFYKFVRGSGAEIKNGTVSGLQYYTSTEGETITSYFGYELNNGVITPVEDAGTMHNASTATMYNYSYGYYMSTVDGNSIYMVLAQSEDTNSYSQTKRFVADIVSDNVYVATFGDDSTVLKKSVSIMGYNGYTNVSYVVDGETVVKKEVIGYSAYSLDNQNGYKFIGWTETEDSSDLFDFANATDDTVLYAVWEALPDINVTFVYPDGTEVEVTEMQTLGIDAPTEPTKDGYKFIGWSLTDGGSGELYDLTNGAETDITLYAVWQELKLVNETYYLASYSYFNSIYLIFYEDGVYEFSYSFSSANVSYGWYEWIDDTIVLHTVSYEYGSTTTINAGWGGTFTDNGDGTLTTTDYKQTSTYGLTVTLVTE